MKKEHCFECNEVLQNTNYEIGGSGEYLCEHCFDEYYEQCSDCGNIYGKDSFTYVESEEKIICEYCLEENYFYCEECQQYHHNNYANYVEGCDYYICDCCRQNGDYAYCYECDNLFHIDDMNYSDRTGQWYCNDCYSGDDELYEYHGFDDYYFFKNEGEQPKYYIGQEIEVEPKGCSDVSGVLEAIKDNNINAVGMEDSSLNYGGVEIVSHPETWEYKLSHKDNYKNMFRDLQNINYGDDGGAGLHFHVSRPNDDIISRVIVLLESFKTEIKKLSRRSDGQLNQWAKFLTDYYSSDEDKIKHQSTKYLKEEYIKGYHDRYLALNLNNSQTIEFRFFNGVNNFEEFWAALQFIHNLMEIAFDETREINTIQWQDLIYGEELINQATKLDVMGVVKYAKDTTEIYEKVQKVKEQTKEEIKRTLKNFIKYINRQMASMDIESIKSNDINNITRNSKSFIRSLVNELDYLDSVVSAYDMIDNSSISNIKSQTTFLRREDELRGKKYTRYFKQLDTILKNYESEVFA